MVLKYGFWPPQEGYDRWRVQTAVVMLLVAASVVMGGFLTRAQIPQDFALDLDITNNQWVILAILNVFFGDWFFLHLRPRSFL